MAKFDHFDFISPLYDLIFGRRIDQEIVAYADVQIGDSLLDVGGGTGRVSVLFRDKIQNVLVIDASIKMLREAQAKGLTTVNSNSERLPFADGTFERIIIVDALHHVENQSKTLREMWRILKKGGKMIVEEPDINNFVVKLIALGEKILLMRSHFIAPDKIAVMSRFDENVVIDIKRDKGIAWVVIHKN